MECNRNACERTCEELEPTCSTDINQCYSGCFCKDGYARKGSRCVPLEQCRSCSCGGFGDPHYYGFDSKLFYFSSACTHVLAMNSDFKRDDPNSFRVRKNENSFDF